MSSIDAMRRQVAEMRSKVGRPEDPRSWFFCLPDGADIPSHIVEQIKPRDQVVVRYYPKNYVDTTGASIGYVSNSRGKVTILYGTD